MVNGNVLIIDDNPNVLSALEILLLPEYREVITLSDPNKLDTISDFQKIDLVLLDMNFTSKTKQGNEGLFWLEKIKRKAPDVKVIMITAYGDVELAVKAIKNGASDFILKPWKNDHLLTTLKTTYLLKKSKHNTTQKTITTALKAPEIIGSYKSFRRALDLIHKISKLDINLLISGENGTGKELLAKEFHFNSLKKDRKFITLDIDAIDKESFESELFKKLEAAKGSILFINSIDKLPIYLQSKLLAVLLSKKTANGIQLICSSKIDLKQAVKQGAFLEDVLYHISTINVDVPSLRNRGNDIIELTNHYLEKFKNKYQKNDIEIHDTAKQKILSYTWPGNVRELKHCLERAVILSTGLFIRDEDLNLEHHSNYSAQNPTTLSEMEFVMIEKALSNHQGNYSAAANQLGISRQTLYNKIKKLSPND